MHKIIRQNVNMYNSFAKEFGKILREKRYKQKFSLDDVAYWADISPGFLGKIERGQQTATLKVIFQISRALDIGLDELFKFDDIDKFPFERKD